MRPSPCGLRVASRSHAHGWAVAGAARGAIWESRKRGGRGALRGGSVGPMQDAENVAVPEAAEERAEPGQQQLAAEPPPDVGLLRPGGPGAPEAAGTEAVIEEVAAAEAGPEPEVRTEAEAASVPSESPSQSAAEEPPGSHAEPRTPAQGEARGKQALDDRGDSLAQAASEDAGGNEGSAAEAEPRALENGDADEPSFSDPEDFVDDVSEEGEGARGGAGERRGSVSGVSEVGDVVELCHRFVHKFQRGYSCVPEKPPWRRFPSARPGGVLRAQRLPFCRKWG
ncbi:hypothetical protein P7K49_003458 [Saguinus oedipus]|uniref:Uncharacterized protein n=1 Tax=Saguinus oedipus TaxID=9490 RepID=A0ABQ9W858_SAGOE|nr:hypothetical protein P7K49_003458 [Saguinus oedipus]